jgi:hypothetical protein
VTNPLDFIPNPVRKKVFISLLTWTMLLFAMFQVLNISLTNSVAPLGIVSHQLAWTPAKAQAILASWDTHARMIAAFGLGLDYLFMTSYALTVALGALLAAGRHKGWYASLGSWAALSVFAAVLFDAFENAGQAHHLLNGIISAPVIVITGICSVLKFALLILAILYDLSGWLIPKSAS